MFRTRKTAVVALAMGAAVLDRLPCNNQLLRCRIDRQPAPGRLIVHSSTLVPARRAQRRGSSAGFA
jgi:hypothetical protein